MKDAATPDQKTGYVQQTAGGDVPSAVCHIGLTRAEIYPDLADADDRIRFAYNRLGEVVQMVNQRGTTHVYEFDALGRQTQDRVTVLGSGVDGAVRRIETGHEARGMRQRVTRCDGVTAVTGSPLPAPPPDTIG